MRRLHFIGLIFLLFAGMAWPASGQFGQFRRKKEAPFFVRIANFPGKNEAGSKLFVFVSVPYDELVFVRADSGFAAHYTCGVYLYDKKGRTVFFEKNWRRTLQVKGYEETNRRGIFDRFTTSIQANPGEYRLVLRLKDRQVPRPYIFKKEVEIRNFNAAPLQLSSLLLLDVRSDSCQPGVVPMPDATGHFAQDFFAYFEGIKKSPEAIPLLLEVVRQNRRDIVQTDTLIFQAGKKRACFQVQVDVDSLRNGPYRIRVRPLQQNKLRPVEAAFRVVKAMEFRTERELDDAIAALRYIAEPETLAQMEKAESFQEKKKRFDRFWKELDPTPDTEFNELQNEFYQRVAYANEHFSQMGDDGWRTDRGQIYIIYGPPDTVEHQTDQNFREFEIWRYNELNREFVFWDRDGSGDYQLVRSK